jgi:hypothetical protein
MLKIGLVHASFSTWIAIFSREILYLFVTYLTAIFKSLRIQSAEWKGDQWTTNWNQCGRKQSWPNLRYYPGIGLEGLTKNQEKREKYCSPDFFLIMLLQCYAHLASFKFILAQWQEQLHYQLIMITLNDQNYIHAVKFTHQQGAVFIRRLFLTGVCTVPWASVVLRELKWQQNYIYRYLNRL